MNILIITVYKSFLHGGGAASASTALEKGIIKAGHQVKIISREDFAQPYKIDPFFDLPAQNTFSANPFGRCDNDLLPIIENYNPDIVVLGAIDREILSFSSILQINRPIILIFHDLYPVTGGCLFQGGIGINRVPKKYTFYDSYRCIKYHQDCSECPLLINSSHKDLPRLNHNLKRQVFLNRKDIVLAPVSGWMKETLAYIPYLEHHLSKILYNIIDEKVFKPIPDASSIRKQYKLPIKKHLGLIISHSLITANDLKGFFLVLDAFSKLKICPDNLEFCAIGNAVSKPKTIDYHGFVVHFLGFIEDAMIKARIFAASDFFVCSAIHENLPMVCLESLSCGTPVIAFAIGGISSDIVKHKYNGYLVKPFSSEDMALGIEWLCGLSDSEKQDIAKNCRQHIKEKFTEKVVIKQFEVIAELARNNFLKKSFESRPKISHEIANLQLLLNYLKSRVQHSVNIPFQDRWYRFGQLSKKQKLWKIGKICSKKIKLYKYMRPFAKIFKVLYFSIGNKKR